MDGDGCPDYVVGAVHDRSQGWNHGAAYVYSGRTGALIRAHYGRTTFGSDVAGGGDVDGDGIGDVIVGAIQECPQVDCVGGLKNGAVYVFSGATGEQLHKFVGVGPVTTIGTSVDAAGDVDGDGHDDILTGGWTGYGGRGVVMVYSGKTGDRIHTIPGAELTYWLGQDVAGVGDVNGDGHPDFAAGEPRASIGAQLTGRVTVFSGADGSKLWRVHGEAEEQLYRVAGAGDINLDGTPDLIVSSSIGSGNGYRRKSCHRAKGPAEQPGLHQGKIRYAERQCAKQHQHHRHANDLMYPGQPQQGHADDDGRYHGKWRRRQGGNLIADSACLKCLLQNFAQGKRTG